MTEVAEGLLDVGEVVRVDAGRVLDGHAVDVLLTRQAARAAAVSAQTLLLTMMKFGLIARRFASRRRTRSTSPSVHVFFSDCGQLVQFELPQGRAPTISRNTPSTLRSRISFST